MNVKTLSKDVLNSCIHYAPKRFHIGEKNSPNRDPAGTPGGGERRVKYHMATNPPIIKAHHSIISISEIPLLPLNLILGQFAP